MKCSCGYITRVKNYGLYYVIVINGFSPDFQNFIEAALTSPVCYFAWLGIFWAGCHWHHASCEGTGVRPAPQLWKQPGSSGRQQEWGWQRQQASRYELNTWMWLYCSLQGSATPGYCRRGWAAKEGSHLRRSHEGCRDSEASQGRARGRLLQPKIPGREWWICIGLKTSGAI